MTSLEKYGHRDGNKFPKAEKLKSKIIIEELFEKGSSIYLHPYRIFFLPSKNQEPGKLPQVLISIPKRTFKKSVDRNRIRRQVREAYRLNKSKIFNRLQSENIPAFIGFVYIAKEKIPFEILQEKLILILERLKKN